MELVKGGGGGKKHAPKTVIDLDSGMVDIAEPGHVEIEIRNDGEVVWVHVDGITRLRVCRTQGAIFITDHRKNRKYVPKGGNPEGMQYVIDLKALAPSQNKISQLAFLATKGLYMPDPDHRPDLITVQPNKKYRLGVRELKIYLLSKGIDWKNEPHWVLPLPNGKVIAGHKMQEEEDEEEGDNA